MKRLASYPRAPVELKVLVVAPQQAVRRVDSVAFEEKYIQRSNNSRELECGPGMSPNTDNQHLIRHFCTSSLS